MSDPTAVKHFAETEHKGLPKHAAVPFGQKTAFEVPEGAISEGEDMAKGLGTMAGKGGIGGRLWNGAKALAGKAGTPLVAGTAATAGGVGTGAGLMDHAMSPASAPPMAAPHAMIPSTAPGAAPGTMTPDLAHGVPGPNHPPPPPDFIDQATSKGAHELMHKTASLCSAPSSRPGKVKKTSKTPVITAASQASSHFKPSIKAGAAGHGGSRPSLFAAGGSRPALSHPPLTPTVISQWVKSSGTPPTMSATGMSASATPMDPNVAMQDIQNAGPLGTPAMPAGVAAGTLPPPQAAQPGGAGAPPMDPSQMPPGAAAGGMPPQAPAPQPLPPSPIDPQMQNSMQQLIGDQSMPAGGGDMRFNKIVSAFAVGPDLKSTFAKYAADDDSSLLGRYGALWGLQSQSAISKPWSSTAASGAGSAASAAAGMPGIILAPLSNVVAMRGPDKEKRLHGMVSDAKARKGHFGESFMHGISRAGIPYGLWRSGSGFPLGLSMA